MNATRKRNEVGLISTLESLLHSAISTRSFQDMSSVNSQDWRLMLQPDVLQRWDTAIVQRCRPSVSVAAFERLLSTKSNVRRIYAVNHTNIIHYGQVEALACI